MHCMYFFNSKMLVLCECPCFVLVGMLSLCTSDPNLSFKCNIYFSLCQLCLDLQSYS